MTEVSRSKIIKEELRSSSKSFQSDMDAKSSVRSEENSNEQQK